MSVGGILVNARGQAIQGVWWDHVMYTSVMTHRTQVTVTDSQYIRLKQESDRTGVGLAELIRRALTVAYGDPARSDTAHQRNERSMADRINQVSATTIDELLDEATRVLVEAAHPEKIIVFGSYARGDIDEGSDLDLLIILPIVVDRFEEMHRLRLVLRDIPMAIDVIVYSRADVEERQHLRGTMLYHALREGRILHDAAYGRHQLGFLCVSFRVHDLPLNALPDGRRVPLDRRGLRIDRRRLETCRSRFGRTHPGSDHGPTQLR